MVSLGRRSVQSTGDLLKQIEGADARLTKGVQLRWFGRLGTAVSSAGLAYLAKQGVSWEFWLVPSAALAGSAAAVSQGREWIRGSRQPFRYTYSVEPFEPVSGQSDIGLEPLRDWIRADLVLMLSERIGRLSLLPEDQIPEDAPDRPASHIHISGSYGVRQQDGEITIELMPLVRIGSACCSATVAHWVRQPLTALDQLVRDRTTYDEILERLYFSVATQIYKQIRLDVDRKIGRLPTAYLRATAYFHEAEDYARSNTLDAFDDARKLYTKALDLYDRSRRTLPKHWWQRPWQWFLLKATPIWRRAARRIAWVLPRFGRRDVQIGRVRTGYAKALLFRNVLANLSGRQPHRVFEARRIVLDAIEDLKKIPEGVPGVTRARFDAYVTAAFAESWSLNVEAARTHLDNARDLLPDGDGQALYPLVSAAVEPRLQRRVRLLRRAVELEPRFEIAHFEIAFNTEQLWRSGEELEKEGGDLVDDAYEDVTILNPANLTAWANRGYVRWLLWDPAHRWEADEVARPFLRGSRYKEIRQKTFVAELDYGLARVAAEQGEIAKAYEYYTNASRATMAQEGTRTYVEYCFDRVNDAILERYKKYKKTVEAAVAREAEKQEPARLPTRITNSVLAYALTDWGNACAAYYRRSGDLDYRDAAQCALNEALELNPRNLLALRSRADLNTWIAGDDVADRTPSNSLEDAKADLKQLLEQEPRWAPGQIELVQTELALLQKQIAEAVGRERLARKAESTARLDREAKRTALLADEAISAAKRLFGRDSILPDGWIAKAERIEQLPQPDRRQPEEILNAVTGPMAAKALTLRAKAHGLSQEMQAKAEKLCLFLLTHFVPGDYDLHRLRLTLVENAAERTPRSAQQQVELRRQLQEIVIRKVETDPAHQYWLKQLRDVGVADTAGGSDDDEDDRTRIHFLRTAVRWPGAAAHTLLWVAAELRDLEDWESSAEAYERAAEKQPRYGAEANKGIRGLAKLAKPKEPQIVPDLHRRARQSAARAKAAAT